MFYISSGCSLYLEALHFVDGVGDYGGAVFAYGAGDIAMKGVSFTGCEASQVRRPSLPRTARPRKLSPHRREGTLRMPPLSLPDALPA